VPQPTTPLPPPNHLQIFGKIKKNELGGECGTCGREEWVLAGFWWGKLREKDHLEELGTDWGIILKCV
jgi:hypothetical protein